jgi:uracil-DNA glycosylase
MDQLMTDGTDAASMARRFIRERQELGDALWPRVEASAKPARTIPPAPDSVPDEAVEHSMVHDALAESEPETPVEKPASVTRKPEPVPDEPRIEETAVPPVDEQSEAPAEQPAPKQAPPPEAITSPVTEANTVGEPASTSWAGQTLEQFGQGISNCQLCQLGTSRKNFVFGEGDPNADIMFIGEAPGQDEDMQGRPFVGRAGQLLTKMILAMGLTREEVYIANILKCRPPGNRNPLPKEADLCMPYLRHQIELIQPKMLCLMGRVAASTLLNTNLSLGRLRDTWHELEGIRTIVTYHPAALLRNPNWKRPAWEDLKKLRFELDGTVL